MFQPENYEAPKVLHRPLQPPRTSVPREGLYLAAWQQFATERPLEWVRIFDTSGPVRQRAASVAASFMVFMGCNGGNSFTQQALRYRSSGVFCSAESAFLAAWAIENRRIYWINHGLRAIEFLLSRDYPIDQGHFKDRVDWKKVPAISMDDVDIVESMVAWWSTKTAELMREMVEAQFKAQEASLRAQQREGQ